MNAEYIHLCSIPSVQEKIRERMGKVLNGDMFAYKVTETVFVAGVDVIIEGRDILLPQAIDLQNPERGLWGMVDWNHQPLNNLVTKSIEIDAIGRIYQGRGVWQTPELALLLALIYQWEIKE